LGWEKEEDMSQMEGHNFRTICHLKSHRRILKEGCKLAITFFGGGKLNLLFFGLPEGGLFLPVKVIVE
jgi:hypothetical protein